MTGSSVDRIGASYDEAQADPPGQLAAGAWLLEQLAGRPHPLVLDLGCGAGLPTARQLIDGGCDVVGVDASTEQLRAARHNVPEAIFVERTGFDLDGLHPPHQRFDAVVSFFSMSDFTEAQVVRALDDIRHVLSPTGLLVLGLAADPAPRASYTKEQLRLLMQLHGFAVREMRAAADGRRRYALCAVS